MDYFLAALKKYAIFDGRARRKEYWMFVLFGILCSMAVTVLDMAIGTVFLFRIVFTLGIIIPSISVSIRRLHDIGKSGVWYFITFVPLIGGIWYLILMCTEGNAGENQYGSDPKEP